MLHTTHKRGNVSEIYVVTTNCYRTVWFKGRQIYDLHLIYKIYYGRFLEKASICTPLSATPIKTVSKSESDKAQNFPQKETSGKLRNF